MSGRERSLWLRLTLTLVILWAATGLASATDYFVRTDGSDGCTGRTNAAYSSGSGTSCAFLTVRKCSEVASAGDRCRIAPGRYLEDDLSTSRAGSKTDNVASGCTCTSGGTQITCSSAPSGVQAGDFVQCDQGYGFFWTEVASVSGSTVTLAEGYLGPTSSSDTLDRARMIQFVGQGNSREDVVISAWVPEPSSVSWTLERDCVYSYPLSSASRAPWSAPSGLRQRVTLDSWDLHDANKNGLDSFTRTEVNECPCARGTLVDAVKDIPGSWATDGAKVYAQTWSCQDPDTVAMEASDGGTYGDTFEIAHPFVILRGVTLEAGNADDTTGGGSSNNQNYALRTSATENFLVRDVRCHNGKCGTHSAPTSGLTDVLFWDVRALNGFNPPEGVQSGFRAYGLEARGGFQNMISIDNMKGASAADPVIFDRFYLHRGFTNLKDSTCGQSNNWVCEASPGHYEPSEKYTAVHGFYAGNASLSRQLDNILIQNCILEITYDGIGIFTSAGQNNVKIRNCTFQGGEYLLTGTTASPGGGLKIYNSAWHCASGDCVRNIAHYGSSNWDAVNSDYNAYLYDSNSSNIPADKLHWTNKTDGYPDYTLDQVVQNEGEEAHSIVVCASGCSSSQVRVFNDGARNTKFTDTRTDDGDPTDWTPLAGSRLIDAGLNAECPPTDFFGRARRDGRCDIGAIEFNGGGDPPPVPVPPPPVSGVQRTDKK